MSKAHTDSPLAVELDRSTAKPSHARMLRLGRDIPFGVTVTRGKVMVQLLGGDPFDERAVGRIGSDGQLYWALDAVDDSLPDGVQLLRGLQIETAKIVEPIMVEVRKWLDEQD